MDGNAGTIIIGAGQAGLAMSRCLRDRGLPHLVLERGQVAQRWRSERWHSFTLLSPNHIWYEATLDDPQTYTRPPRSPTCAGLRPRGTGADRGER
jgi:cation diffusion facilitator CzcD-associated flavoprotein CzcO